ncbi:MAG: DUF3732 domain-containing protein [Deltaproteobacteria bacterium]|nr:DUF3732 domain-containing protein [Deltaproteobacteria bacterium]
MTVVRPVPQEGHSGSQEIHFQTGTGLQLPAAAIDGRWNIESAKERISEFAGIEAMPLLQRDNEDEDSFSAANIRHAVPFLFQPQDVIASRVVSFPGLEDFFYKRHVLDALDYFLRVFGRDLLSARRELRQLEAEQRAATRMMAETRRLGADGYERGQQLLADAIATGMSPDGRADSLNDIRSLLRAALATELNYDTLTSASETRFAVEAEREARAEYHSLRHQISVAEAESRYAGAHKSVVAGGIEKINLRSLLPRKPANEACPLCGSSELHADDLTLALDAAATALGREQSVPERLHSESTERIAGLRERERRALTRLRAAERSLRALFTYLSEQRSVVDELRHRERLRGHIEAYLLATTNVAEPDTEHAARILQRIAELTGLLRGIDDRRRGVQETVEKLATAIAAELGVEFEDPTRVDLNNLMLQVKAGARWVSLAEFGSGANWVSYHVACTLALAHVFATRSAPVPRFVVFDQPSQAWFPPELSERGAELPAKSDDRMAVERLYSVLAERAALSGAPQIIVLDHARIAKPWFTSRVVEDWHQQGAALVPSDWIIG